MQGVFVAIWRGLVWVLGWVVRPAPSPPQFASLLTQEPPAPEEPPSAAEEDEAAREDPEAPPPSPGRIWRVPARLLELRHRRDAAIRVYLCIQAGEEVLDDGTRRSMRARVQDVCRRYWPEVAPGVALPGDEYLGHMALQIRKEGVVRAGYLPDADGHEVLVYQTVDPAELADPRQLHVPDLYTGSRLPADRARSGVIASDQPDRSRSIRSIADDQPPQTPPSRSAEDQITVLPIPPGSAGVGTGESGKVREREKVGAPAGACVECWALSPEDAPPREVPVLGDAPGPASLLGVGLTVDLRRSTCADCLVYAVETVRRQYPVAFEAKLSGVAPPEGVTPIKSLCALFAKCLEHRRAGRAWRTRLFLVPTPEDKQKAEVAAQKQEAQVAQSAEAADAEPDRWHAELPARVPDAEAPGVWAAAVAQLGLGPRDRELWIEPVRPIAVEPGIFWVEIPNEFLSVWFAERFGPQITALLAKERGPMELRWCRMSGAPSVPAPTPKEVTGAR